MFKNVASQKVTVFAFDYSTGAPKTGDAANLTVYVSKDDGAVTALTDTSATELDATNAKGSYSFDLSQAETNADKLVFTGKSSTSNVAIVAQTIYTAPASFTAFVTPTGAAVNTTQFAGTNITSAAGIPEVKVASIAANAVTAAAIATDAIDADAIAADAVTEIQSGLSTLNAAGVRAAVGLASANLDTQLSTIDDFIDTEIAAILAAVDTEVAAIKAKTDNLPVAPAATGDAMTLTSAERNAVADALLTRNIAGGSSTGRTVKEALYRLRNRVAIAAGTATVYGTDDSTSAWTAAVTTTAGNPVSEVDPA